MRFLFIQIAIILLLLKSINVYAQSKVAIGFEGTPTFTGPEVYHDEYSFSFAFAYDFGLNVQLKLNQKITLKTSIGYKMKASLYKNQNTERFIGYYNSPFVKAEKYDFRQNLNYADVSLLIRYKLSKSETRKLSFHFSLGFDVDYNYRGKNITKYSDRTESYVYYPLHNHFTYTVSFGPGLLYDISKRINISFEPKYSYDFYSTVDWAKFQSIGCSLGLAYKLKSK